MTSNNKIKTLEVLKNRKSSYYQYPIFLHSSVDRDKLILILKNKYKIPSKRIRLPTHQEEIFKDLDFDRNTLLKTEHTFSSSLCLPIHFSLKNREVKKIIKAVLKEV